MVKGSNYYDVAVCRILSVLQNVANLVTSFR